MQVTRIQAYRYSTPNQKLSSNNNYIQSHASYSSVPVSFRYNADIHFGEFFDPNRTVPHIDYEEYMAMSPVTKRRYRKVYESFPKNVNAEELVVVKDPKLPLRSERNMDEFIKTAKIYSRYKDQPIICLGRSPKWFLNAALWMNGGINDYKFAAFSKYWFRPDAVEGMRRIEAVAPTPKEEQAYHKYLKRIKADPKTIVENFEKTGKKTVITDYICSGKGACSFLDMMAKLAEEQGLLEQFSKSIEIVGIGSMDYMEELNPYADSISRPTVPMPPRLQKYGSNIKQTFYDMDYSMFREMLLNQNTNECRSSYYPHDAWTVYKPDQFRTGLINDMKKVKEIVKTLKEGNKSMSSFTPAMYDFRNLLNFRILDALSQRNILKAIHKSKI